MRTTLRVLTACLVSLGAVLASPVAATPAAADTDDFSYERWSVDYVIDKDPDGRAVARVTETVTPVFPDFDQNRGIVRGIPIDYQGTSSDPRDFSVTDTSGAPLPFEIEDEGGFRIVLTGDDSYLHGRQTFVITYTLSDVVLARDDGTADEFYWDVMDFEHLQEVAAFDASVAFTDGLAQSLTGAMRCYADVAEGTSECALSGTGTESDPIVMGPRELAPRTGVTLAIGLEPGSIVQPPRRLPNFALDGLPLAFGGGGLAVGAVGAAIVGRDLRRRRTGRGTVIAQYDVPQHLPPLLAAPVFGRGESAASAEIVHLAVIGATRLEDVEGKRGSRTPRRAVHVVDPARAADPLDTAMLGALAPGAAAGTSVTIPKQSTAFAERMSAVEAAGVRAADERGYFERIRVSGARGVGICALVIGIGSGAFSLVALALRGPGPALFGGLLSLVALLLGAWSLGKHRAYTPHGAETREYLAGVKLFIEVAEADRIKMLQSPEGAERRTIEGREAIHLYERLLPYAMLFGLEREWSRTLEVRYQADPGYVPYWYPAMMLHGTGGMHRALSGYTSALTSSVSYTSSSSGGSSGGGFAGGGGGGGFSGGR